MILQISRIQIRRGLKQDLPQLASGELGWAIDTRQLFVGNGTPTEGAPIIGNTEILTEFSNVFDVNTGYTFKGNAAGFVSQTGVTSLNPISRSIQNKLDDFANVRDFGAVGDGVTNDVAAINRAIDQLYNPLYVTTNSKARRTLYFPAGTYLVSGDIVKLVPYLRIQGDGKENTIILQNDNTQTCCATTADSNVLVGTAMGTTGGILPTNIEINDVKFSTSSDQPVLLLDSAKACVFRRVAFSGSQSSPVSIGSGNSSVTLKSTKQTTRGIYLDNCSFTNSFLGVLSDELSKNITINGSYFDSVYQGVKLGEFSTLNNYPIGVKVTNSTFDSVAAQGIKTFTGTSGIISSNNYYNNVGTGFLGNGNPIYPVVEFGSDDNYSFGDTFERPDSDAVAQPRVKFINRSCIAALPHYGLKIGSKIQGPGKNINLNDNQVIALTAISLPSQLFTNGIVVEYSISRGSLLRTGSMKIIQSGTNVSYSDEYVEFDGTPVGVTLTVKNISGINQIQYTSTSTGTSAVMSFNFKYFSDII